MRGAQKLCRGGAVFSSGLEAFEDMSLVADSDFPLELNGEICRFRNGPFGRDQNIPHFPATVSRCRFGPFVSHSAEQRSPTGGSPALHQEPDAALSRRALKLQRKDKKNK